MGDGRWRHLRRPLRRHHPASGRRAGPTHLTTRSRRTGAWVTALALAAIGAATLGPVRLPSHIVLPSSACVLCGDYGATDFVLNVLLFLPYGLGLALLGLRPRRALTAVVATTFLVELLQATIIQGRHPALGDLVANSIGGWLGAIVPLRSGTLARPGVRGARFLVGVTTATALALVLLPLVLLRPAPHPSPTWWGQHAHHFGGMALFTGRLQAVDLDGSVIPEGRLRETARIRSVFGDGEILFAAEFTAGDPTPLRAQIAAIADGTGGWVVALWQEGDDAILSVRQHAATVRLKGPVLRIPDALATPFGTPIRVELRADHQGIAGRVARPDTTLVSTLPATTTAGWLLLWPWDPTRERVQIGWTLAWLVLLCFGTTFGLAWYGRLARLDLLTATVAGGFLPFALGVVPQLSSTPTASPAEWLFAAIAVLSGWIMARRVGQRATRGADPDREQ